MQGFKIHLSQYIPNLRASWYGFDLDGTLAYHYQGDDTDSIGAAVPRMLQRLKQHLARGDRCKIMTARAGQPEQDKMIQDWLERQGVPRLEVTNQKDYLMIMFYDDRARQVIPNTGVVVGE